MNIKHTLISSAVMAFAAFQALGNVGSVPALGIEAVEVEPDTVKSIVTIRWELNTEDYDLGTDGEMWITPVIVAADADSLVDAFSQTVVAGRTRYIRHKRNAASLPLGTALLRGGSKNVYRYNAGVAWQKWMADSKVELRLSRRGCCGNTSYDAIVPVATIDLVPRPAPAPQLVVEKTTDRAERIVEIKGSAFINFKVNRVEIEPEYRSNPIELGKIRASIEKVRDIPEAQIVEIVIKGYASPEGPYDNNVRLAQGRTVALKEYVKARYGYPEEIFTTEYCPEDWQGLRDTLPTLDISRKDEIIRLIDSDLAPDAKKAELRSRFPSQYKFLLDNIYPALRHSDYVVRYTIKEYDEIEGPDRVVSVPSAAAPEPAPGVLYVPSTDSIDYKRKK